MSTLMERFLRYVEINSKSNEDNTTCPSTSGQLELARILSAELKEIGLEEVEIDDNGYLSAVLPANTNKETPVIGFIAHMDTSPEVSSANVKATVFRNYSGNDIVLGPQKHIVLSPVSFPELLNYTGQTIIASDGENLLGADDKAGIAEIITAMEYLFDNPEIEHGPIKIAFTPDEEIGRGADFFDVEKFGADFAYTVDGGGLGELEYENFNAAVANIRIQGLNVHPGSAKDKMINSIQIAMELNAMLPVNERPEFTSNYEGFYHLLQISGTVEESSMEYIIRDHDKARFEKRKALLGEIVVFLNQKYGEKQVALDIRDQYYNMREKIEEVRYIIDLAEESMNNVGVNPLIKAIRGGTDGARLSYMQLPCPNLFTGGHNFHSRYEFIPLESMEKAVELIVEIVRLSAIKDF